MIRLIRRYLGAKRLQLRNPRLRLGSRTTVNSSEFEDFVAIGDDAMVLRSSIGLHSYVGPRCIIADSQIGRFCSIAADVAIGTGSHPLGRNAALHPIFYLHRPPEWDFVASDSFREFRTTSIGCDVWIGTKAVLRDGVTVGHGAVVGAGAIVLGDLEPYGIYAGVPARLIRYRFPEETRQKLLSLAWWERDIDWIRRHAPQFSDVDELLSSAGDI